MKYAFLFVSALLGLAVTGCTVPQYAFDAAPRGDACVPCGEAGCVSLLFDPDHCGSCTTRCTEGPNSMRACSQGVCRPVCRPGFGDCDGDASNGCETDVTVSAQNCGGCGNRCSPDGGGGLMCSGGRCVSTCPPGRANCNGTLDDGCETSTTADIDNCGSCGNACAGSANGRPVCTDGTCGQSCIDTFADCDRNPGNGCETSLNRSTLNCGMCGRACTAATGGMLCTGNPPQCRPECLPGDTLCHGECVNFQTDPDHCGSCDPVAVCMVGGQRGTRTCEAGACGVLCPAGWGNCDASLGNGCETNLGTTVAHCGMCGRECPVPPNTVPNCAAGVCGWTCATGFGNCDGNMTNGCETNLGTTVAHCGMCGRACMVANGTPGCAAGACTVTACSPGFANCAGGAADGCETNTTSNPAHCGMCGRACTLANAVSGCSASSCTIAMCNAGFASCDGDTANGCETNTSTSVAHCGACNRGCALANATASCSASMCTVAMCTAGFGNCDSNMANGCETPLTTATNCGRCGGACGAGQVCRAGVCADACAAGQTLCSGACAVLSTDPRNCGACGTVCSIANGTAGCAAGVCTVNTCNSGFSNCVNGAADGCETNINTSPANCGACSRVCSLANASPGCAGGVCSVAACNAGFGNCDGNPANGCETNTTNNPAHCNGCGLACAFANATSPACAGSACTLGPCTAGFGNCDSVAANGCETNVSTNPSHCGTCGRVCSFANAGAGCAGGACVLGACAGGWGNCNLTPGDGCETNLTNDVNNCGTCGRSCAVANGTGACGGGTCSITACNPGFYLSGSACVDVPPSRQLTPPSTSIVSTTTPRFTVERVPGVPASHIEICSDSACATRVQYLRTGGGVDTVDAAPLAAGLYFWRAYGASGTVAGTTPSSIWQFRVPRNAGGGFNTFYSTELDWRRLGLATALIGAAGGNQVHVFRWNGSAMAYASSLDEPAGSTFGSGVANAGDVNGDGLGDIIIGNCSGGAPVGDCNAVFVYRGNFGGGPTLMQTLAAPAGSSGFSFGLSAAGDVNGDGYGDIIVGAYASNTAYLWYGSARGMPFNAAPDVTLSAALACPTGCPAIVPGGTGAPLFGVSVSGAADFNGDRFADIMIGAPTGGWDRVFIYAGGPSGLVMNPTSTLAPVFGTVRNFGLSVAEAGDVSNDGRSDLIVGGNANGGVAHLYLGAGGGVAIPLNNPGTATDAFGVSVDGAGDTNGDGFADLIVGASNRGAAYIYLGNSTGAAANPSVTIMPGLAYTGRWVSGTGDFDNDGFADVVVSACQPPAAAGCSDAVFFCRGSASGINGGGCQRANGTAGHLFGSRIAALSPWTTRRVHPSTAILLSMQGTAPAMRPWQRIYQ